MSNNSSSNFSNSSEEYEEIDWCGRIIKNTYIVLNKLGKGSYCTVWNTYDINNQIMYALKIYNEEDTDDAKKEILMIDEVRKLNIPYSLLYNKSFEYIDEASDDTYIMQIYDLCGYSLYYILKILKNDFNTKLYSHYINFVYNAINKICYAITKLNDLGYAHTDIKPENILIDKPTLESSIILNHIKKLHNDKILLKKKGKIKNIIESLRNDIIKFLENLEIVEDDIKKYILNFDYSIKIADFGTAMKHGDKQIYKKHTSYYKSLKIILGYELDRNYDFWSIGCSIYEMLTGKILFDYEDPYLVESFGDNEDRNLIYLMCCTFGLPSNEIINNSSLKDVFFTSDNKCIKNYDIIKKKLIISELLDKQTYIDDKETHEHFLVLIKQIVQFLQY